MIRSVNINVFALLMFAIWLVPGKASAQVNPGYAYGQCNVSLNPAQPDFQFMVSPVFYEGAPNQPPVFIASNEIASDFGGTTSDRSFRNRCISYFRAACATYAGVYTLGHIITDFASVFDFGAHTDFIIDAENKIKGIGQHILSETSAWGGAPSKNLFKNLTCKSWNKDKLPPNYPNYVPENDIFNIPENLMPDGMLPEKRDIVLEKPRVPIPIPLYPSLPPTMVYVEKDSPTHYFFEEIYTIILDAPPTLVALVTGVLTLTGVVIAAEAAGGITLTLTPITLSAAAAGVIALCAWYNIEVDEDKLKGYPSKKQTAIEWNVHKKEESPVHQICIQNKNDKTQKWCEKDRG